MPNLIFLRLKVFLLLVAVVLASEITSFTDAKCTRSWRALNTVNGYPDGLCKPLNVAQGQSFQVQELDRGCAVTLYGENEGPLVCSSAIKIVGHLATCYDSSWVYYSIDGCLPPTSSSAKVPSTKPTAIGPPATKSASATPEPNDHTEVIIGFSVAGLSCVILSLTGALLIRIKRVQNQTQLRRNNILKNCGAIMRRSRLGEIVGSKG
ncbi:uncharacterized protein M421DRAFT_5285 [Didymella exigua CBS 183.55]|uniref:Uncharacterized protein n=1 Tax=Didymella exigua CBS 183.55 TaxID=1150837 RepID=A0A6A5RRV2_9PLEO|nr:uncharacterized protein M421DRAFT_5285 [Didymella exigua CBS 183.55]KAF1928217.1 hypothetical protein M421DRAFT_5285 [Didymella exigua CBS 183.55]